jgi:hypothetical protein
VSQNKAGSAYKNFSVIVNNGLSNLMIPAEVSVEETPDLEEIVKSTTSISDKQHHDVRENEEKATPHPSSITSDLILGVFAGAFIVMSLFLTAMVFFVRKRRIILRQTRRSSSCIFRSSQRNLDWESELEKLHPFSMTAETTETVVSDDDVVSNKKQNCQEDAKGKMMSEEDAVKGETDTLKRRIENGIGNNGVKPFIHKPPRSGFQTPKRGEPLLSYLTNRKKL